MKQLIVLLFFIPVFATAQQTTKEGVAKEFIAAIKANDHKRFVKLYPDAQTMRELYSETMKKNPSFGGDTATMELLLSEMDEELKSMFGKAVKEIKAKKINPAQIIYKSATFVPDKSDEEDMPADVEMYRGKINITAGGKNYYIEVSAMIKYKGVYYGIELEDVGVGTGRKPVSGG